MKDLMHSRRFWTLVLDLVVAIAGFVTDHYIPSARELIMFIVGIMQPMFVFLIAFFTIQDVAFIKQGVIREIK